jgi:hypothetical protein
MTHDDAWHALPFFVNGTLRGSTQADLDAHLAQCAECRSEVAMQFRVRDAIVLEDVREETAQTSFDQLWERITDHTAVVEGAVGTGAGAAAGTGMGGGVHTAAPATAAARHTPAGAMLKWLVAAVVVEGIGLVALGAMTWNGSAALSTNADYRTLSTPAAQLAAGQIRAVFASDLALGNLQALLSGSRLSVVGGPTEAGVFTLALDDENGSVDAALTGLRHSPAVRFAEPIDKPQADSR